jgi:mannosyltransferase OCH1-like enzyme
MQNNFYFQSTIVRVFSRALVSNSLTPVKSDSELKLWTDETARDFIANNYPWFLDTFDGYAYAIQRADAIRYFVLHYYGGVYLDLDVGCRRSLNPLLYMAIVLPETIPVGVSNDIMLAERGHPFMELVINNLMTFDRQYATNYPTV